MRVGYVSYYDPNDVHSWSGTGHTMIRCLERQGIEVIPFGPLRHHLSPMNLARYGFHKYLRRKNDHPHRDPAFLHYYARQVERKLEGSDVDLLFGPGVLPLVYVRTELPVVVWTDCTFASLHEYYAKFSNLSRRTIRNGHEADRLGLQRCDLVLMSCQWAIDSAVNDYGVDPAKCELVSFGANLPPDCLPDNVDALVANRSTERCRLLFMSVDWERKGGPVALRVAEELNRRGVDTELTVVGCEPEVDGPLPSFVKPLGFIKKSTEEGRRRIGELFGTAHFFLLPTRADCTPIVYCEAAAFGLPSLATRTGGVPSVILDDVNGHLFSLDAPARDYADYIERLFRDQDAYRRLAHRTFEEHRDRLNWDVAGRRVASLLEGLLRRRRSE
jgi:glycosyltransferase involved in cell wall biosynthesis